MRRKIIKEQGTQPPVVNATNANHDSMLVLVKQYCNIDANGAYGWVKHPGTGAEVLGRQREDKGYNYIINNNNQVWLEKRKPDNTIEKQGLLEDCQEKISSYAPKPLTSTQNQIIDHFVETKGYIKTRPNQGEIDNGKWEVIDMSTLDPTNFPQKNVGFVYRQKNLENKFINQYPEIQTALNKAGYTFEEPKRTDEALWNTRRLISAILGDSYKTYFKEGEPYVWMMKDKMGTGQFDTEKVKKECKEAIKRLYKNFSKPDFPDIETAEERIQIKNKVHYCKNNKKFAPGILGIGNELDALYTKSEQQNQFGMRGYNPTKRMNENESKLKNLIRENLITAKETKRKTLLGESKIVTSRFAIISEGRKLKTKKDLNKFFSEVISEMTYMNTQGFNKEIISEGFWDMLKGIFGHTPDGVLEYFKEYVGKWLVDNLTPIDPEGWIGSIIITAIGNLPVGDIPKLTDCNFLTKLVAKSVGEGALRKISHEKGIEGPFYDILRNTLVDSLEESSFVQKLEEGLGNVLCPLIGGLSTKMDSAASTLKQKALSV